MKRLFIALILAMFAHCVYAAKFSLSKGEGVVVDENNSVFLFDKTDTVNIQFSNELIDSLGCKWYRYTSSPDEAEELSAQDYRQDSSTTTLLKVLPDCGYYVEYGDSTCDVNLPCRAYMWSLIYKPISKVELSQNEDECQTLDMKVFPALRYVNKNGVEKLINREVSYSYLDLDLNKNFEMEMVTEEDKSIVDTFMSVRTPAVDTKITITDALASKFGLNGKYETEEFKSALPIAFPVMLADEKFEHEADANSRSWEKTEEGKVALPFSKSFEDALSDTSKFKSSADVVIDFKCYHNDRVSPKGYVWEFISGQNALEGDFGSSIRQYDSIMNSYRFSDPGLHCVKLTVSDLNGECESSSFGCFRISESALWIPNAFSPNGDGKNDEFRVAYRSISSFRCRIYDQWGKKVYDSEDISQGWDGDGHSIGVYFYVIEAKGTDGTKYKKKGTVNLLRDK